MGRDHCGLIAESLDEVIPESDRTRLHFGAFSDPTREQQHDADHDDGRSDPLPCRDRSSAQRHAEKQRAPRVQP